MSVEAETAIHALRRLEPGSVSPLDVANILLAVAGLLSSLAGGIAITHEINRDINRAKRRRRREGTTP